MILNTKHGKHSYREYTDDEHPFGFCNWLNSFCIQNSSLWIKAEEDNDLNFQLNKATQWINGELPNNKDEKFETEYILS